MTVHCDYQVFGLRICSALRLPELHSSPSSAAADVLVEFGRLSSDAPSQPGAHDHNGSVILIVDGVARFAITGGGHILIEPFEGARQEHVRLYLLGSALGILLHQRGQLPLHANAVELEGRAYAFMGRSGAGKSTLAALFHDMGLRILADDVCVIRFADDGQAVAAAGIPRLRLWKETLLALGRAIARTMQLGRSKRKHPALSERARATEMVTAVLRASRRVPWRTVCFHEGLALHWMLRRRGIGSLLHYGLSNVQDFGAHVWVSLHDQILIGGGSAPDFHCVATFPTNGQTKG